MNDAFQVTYKLWTGTIYCATVIADYGEQACEMVKQCNPDCEIRGWTVYRFPKGIMDVQRED